MRKKKEIGGFVRMLPRCLKINADERPEFLQ